MEDKTNLLQEDDKSTDQTGYDAYLLTDFELRQKQFGLENPIKFAIQQIQKEENKPNFENTMRNAMKIYKQNKDN